MIGRVVPLCLIAGILYSLPASPLGQIRSSEVQSQSQSSDRPVEPQPLSKQAIQGKVEPSVVKVLTANGTGSGSIISGNRVLTCNHVVKKTDAAEVRLADQKTILPATVIGRSKGEDLAILKVETQNQLPAITFADNAVPGEVVFSLGSPYGQQGKIVEGVVASANDDIVTFNAADQNNQIHPGNSGGPNVNQKGQQNSVVCGISTQNGSIAYARPLAAVKRLIGGGT